MVTEEYLPVQRTERLDYTKVPDGFSVAIHAFPEGAVLEREDARDFVCPNFHVILQHTLPDGTVVRFRITVPKESPDPYQWIVERAVKTNG